MCIEISTSRVAVKVLERELVPRHEVFFACGIGLIDIVGVSADTRARRTGNSAGTMESHDLNSTKTVQTIMAQL
jgi:hypothetical protein